MRTHPEQIIIGLLIICFSSYIYYLFGYRNFFLLDVFFLGTDLLGWMAFLIGLSSLLQPVKQPANTDKKTNDVKTWKSCLSLFVFIVLLVGNYLGILFFSDQRVDNILATQPTKQTTATVVDINVTYGKGGSHPHAVVHYNTDNESLTQELPFKYRLAKMGEQFTIQYSVEYPHMIKVMPGPTYP